MVSRKKKAQDAAVFTAVVVFLHRSSEELFKKPAAFVRPSSQSGVTLTPRTSSVKSSRNDEIAICVAVRVRQILSNEIETTSDPTISIDVDSQLGTICFGKGDQERVFNFDHCIRDLANDGKTANDRQKDLFDRLGAPMVSDVLSGINCTLFAYGQTGTGKTYSLFGTSGEPGLIPRTCKLLLNKLQSTGPETQWSMEISFLEMYNEKLRDLLIPEENAPALKIRDYPGDGVFVQGLSVVPVERFEDIQALIEIGCGRRITACTVNNSRSSRSHVLFTVKVKIDKKITANNETYCFRTTRSSLTMVDLAGSERLSSTTSLKETTSINKSLSCLGMVIDQLSENARFVNHRDSALTWYANGSFLRVRRGEKNCLFRLLKDSLGGNAKTTVLATISPAQRNINETLRTLRYANRAKRMINRVRVNSDGKSSKIVAELVDQLESRNRLLMENHEEIERLQRELSMANSASSKVANRTSVADVQLQYDNESKKSGKNISSSSLIQAPSEPFVVLLSPDPQISEGLLFSLSPGENRIGTDRCCDVVVHGSRIAPLHCTLSLKKDNDAIIVPTKGNDVFVNGILTEDVRTLRNGDRLCLAGEQYFILYLESPKRCNMDGLFDKAQVEYLRAQNERLLDKVESMRVVKKVASESVAVETRIPMRSIGIQENHTEKIVSTPTRRCANTQTARHEAAVSISAEAIDACGSIVAVDFMVLEANSIMESSNDPFRFALCDKVKVEEGEPLCLTVKMINLSMDISIVMPASDFQDHWAVLLALHQSGKRKRFSDYLNSIFFAPEKEENEPTRRVSNLFPLAIAALKESHRTSIASFDGRVTDDPTLTLTPDALKALSGQSALFDEGFASINNIQCSSPKMPIDWFLLSAGNFERLLERFRSNPNEYIFPVMFGLQHMHVCELIYADYPNRMPGVDASRQLFRTAMKRLWNAILSTLKVNNYGGPVRAEPREILSILLGEVVEAAASLSFVMPSVAGSHLLTDRCDLCMLSPHLMKAVLRGAYYGYKQLAMITGTLLDQQFSDQFISRSKVEAVLFGLESLKPIAKFCKVARGDLRDGRFIAFCLLRPLMHSLCCVAGFNDVSFKAERVQNVKTFLDDLKLCPKSAIDTEALKKALISVYPYLQDLHSFENNAMLFSQRKHSVV
ncbi:kinesin protein KIF14 [Trichuris trichiura]|uniref:Kinesin protein KIF14 n=1 Tax=Trichuris trichiura TaxID=36087 RepID=A0A077Z8X7_TRITR|nr:kinesin protein KIF14 [Trichuris trichiura]